MTVYLSRPNQNLSMKAGDIDLCSGTGCSTAPYHCLYLIRTHSCKTNKSLHFVRGQDKSIQQNSFSRSALTVFFALEALSVSLDPGEFFYMGSHNTYFSSHLFTFLNLSLLLPKPLYTVKCLTPSQCGKYLFTTDKQVGRCYVIIKLIHVVRSTLCL